MIGKLDVEEDVMQEDLTRKRKATAVMKTIHQQVSNTIATLGWDCYDDVVVEIGGMAISGIDVGEEYNKKWQSPLGTRKYNKDAFIIIKNQSRRDLSKSQPLEEFKPQHPYERTDQEGTTETSGET